MHRERRPHRSINGNSMHTGLVVYADNRCNRIIRGAVLDLDDLIATGHLYIVQIHQEAFNIPREMLNCELSVRKNWERRLGKPLLFGQMIQYNIDELNNNNQIRKFERIASFITSRYYNDKCQIQLEGMVNPDDPNHFYTEYFHCVKIRDEQIGVAMPDVYVKAWINLLFYDDYTLEYEFDSFDEVCEAEKHVDIGTSPWNKSNKKFQTIPVPDDSDDDDNDDGLKGVRHLIANPGKKSGVPDLELTKVEAYMTGERSFWLIQYPKFNCVAVLKKQGAGLSIGRLYILDCVWNYHEEFYMITNFRASSKKDTLTVESNRLRCSVRAHDVYKGVFYHKKLESQYMDFGVMDDPHGLLSLLHLTKYKHNAIPITMTDPGPSRSGQFRFRIEEIIGDRMQQLKDVLASEDIEILKATGIVIDSNHIYSAEHGLKFSFEPNPDTPPVGTHVQFNGLYDCVKKTLKATDLYVIPDVEPLKVEARCMNKSEVLQNIFSVKAKLCMRKELDKTLYCKEFGLIDDNLKLVKIVTHNSNAREYDVWVSMPVDNHHKVLPRTHFHVVGTGVETPKNLYDLQALTDERKKARREFNIAVKKSAYHAGKGRHLMADRLEDDISSISTRGSLHSNFNSWGTSVSTTPCPVSSESDRRSQSSMGSAKGGSLKFGAGLTGYEENFHALKLGSASSRSDRASVRSEASSVFTDDDEISLNGYITKRDPSTVPPYTGAVRLPERKQRPGYTYDIVETLYRLKTYVPHGSCGTKCSSECPYLAELAILVVKEPDFWQEAQEHFPVIALELVKCINANSEEETEDETFA